jgi:hypothetical protein
VSGDDQAGAGNMIAFTVASKYYRRDDIASRELNRFLRIISRTPPEQDVSASVFQLLLILKAFGVYFDAIWASAEINLVRPFQCRQTF